MTAKAILDTDILSEYFKGHNDAGREFSIPISPRGKTLPQLQQCLFSLTSIGRADDKL